MTVAGGKFNVKQAHIFHDPTSNTGTGHIMAAKDAVKSKRSAACVQNPSARGNNHPVSAQLIGIAKGFGLLGCLWQTGLLVVALEETLPYSSKLLRIRRTPSLANRTR